MVPRLKIIKASPQIKLSEEPMSTETTTQKHFVKYDVKPIQLAGDPQPYFYVKNTEKFDARTTNEDTYYAKKAEKVHTFKPEISSIDRSGTMDLNSHYRNEFIDHGLTMCEAKAYLLAQAIQHKKVESTDKNENNNNNSKTRSVSPEKSLSISRSRTMATLPIKTSSRVPPSTISSAKKLMIPQVS